MTCYLENFVQGPFERETPFQNACTAALKRLWPADTFVHLETEETEPGMPDTIRLSAVRPSLQVEFKVSDTRGNIIFKKSQPLWYRTHPGLSVIIIAWDRRVNRAMAITHDEIVHSATLRYRLNNPLTTPTMPLSYCIAKGAD